MWWSEPDRELARGNWYRRFLFWLDVRQHFVLRFLRRALKDAPSDPVILDFGCGTGGTTLNFAQFLGRPIRGFDVFETQIRIARLMGQGLPVACDFDLLVDGKIPLPDQSVDVLMSLDVLAHVPDVPGTLADWSRVLKTGGRIALFTEATYSAGDRSIMARLASRGADLCAVVPEHVSLHSREELEVFFEAAGFRIEERKSANVGHFFFFPKDYVLVLEKLKTHRALYGFAWAWNRLSKLTPFYPWPFQAIRLMLTDVFGSGDFGTAYFYSLVKRD